MRYEWDDLVWKGTGKIKKAHLKLYPGDTLEVEPGWVIHGATRVSFRWDKSARHVKASYRELSLDLDDPYEYPCVTCGAVRFQPCVGNDPACTFRVFEMKGLAHG
jgi:hypothetical protein